MAAISKNLQNMDIFHVRFMPNREGCCGDRSWTKGGVSMFIMFLNNTISYHKGTQVNVIEIALSYNTSLLDYFLHFAIIAASLLK